MKYIKRMLSYIHNMLNYISNLYVHNTLYRNVMMGYPNSKLELAKFYLIEKQDYVEAYAWADVACLLSLPGALEIKEFATNKLTDLQINEAWEKARQYKVAVG